MSVNLEISIQYVLIFNLSGVFCCWIGYFYGLRLSYEKDPCNTWKIFNGALIFNGIVNSFVEKDGKVDLLGS